LPGDETDYLVVEMPTDEAAPGHRAGWIRNFAAKVPQSAFVGVESALSTMAPSVLTQSLRFVRAGLPIACLAAGMGLIESKSANALTYTTPCVPYATYSNANPSYSSSGSSNNLSFPQFNIPGGTLTSFKLLFTGPNCSGGAPLTNSPGITYGFKQGGLKPPGPSTVSISNISAQVQLFFAGTPLGTNPVGGPDIGFPQSGSFTYSPPGSAFSTLQPTGSYGGTSSPITSAAVLAAFSGTGSVSTSKFQTVWNADLTCTDPTINNCKVLVGADFDVQLGSQVNLFNPPSALFNDAFVSLEYTYSLTSIPSPLPILGAGLGFGWAKRIRRRLAASA